MKNNKYCQICNSKIIKNNDTYICINISCEHYAIYNNHFNDIKIREVILIIINDKEYHILYTINEVKINYFNINTYHPNLEYKYDTNHSFHKILSSNWKYKDIINIIYNFNKLIVL